MKTHSKVLKRIIKKELINIIIINQLISMKIHYKVLIKNLKRMFIYTKIINQKF